MMILDALFPKRCVYCNKVGNYICKECSLKINEKYLFRKVNHRSYDFVICGSFYHKKMKNLLHSFKFHEKSYLYEYLIQLILNHENIYLFLNK